MKSTPVLAILFAVPIFASRAQTNLQLIPQPREMELEGSVSIRSGITIARPANSEDRFAALDLANALTERGIRNTSAESGPGPRVALMRLDASAARSVLRRHSLRHWKT